MQEKPEIGPTAAKTAEHGLLSPRAIFQLIVRLEPGVLVGLGPGWAISHSGNRLF